MTHIEALKDQMIHEIQKNGPIHFLEWIGAVFVQAADAELKDYYADASPEIVELSAVEALLTKTRRATNKSSSVGHNLMEEARIQALSSLIDRRGQFLRELASRRSLAAQASAT